MELFINSKDANYTEELNKIVYSISATPDQRYVRWSEGDDNKATEAANHFISYGNTFENKDNDNYYDNKNPQWKPTTYQNKFHPEERVEEMPFYENTWFDGCGPAGSLNEMVALTTLCHWQNRDNETLGIADLLQEQQQERPQEKSPYATILLSQERLIKPAPSLLSAAIIGKGKTAKNNTEKKFMQVDNEIKSHYNCKDQKLRLRIILLIKQMLSYLQDDFPDGNKAKNIRLYQTLKLDVHLKYVLGYFEGFVAKIASHMKILDEKKFPEQFKDVKCSVEKLTEKCSDLIMYSQKHYEKYGGELSEESVNANTVDLEQFLIKANNQIRETNLYVHVYNWMLVNQTKRKVLASSLGDLWNDIVSPTMSDGKALKLIIEMFDVENNKTIDEHNKTIDIIPPFIDPLTVKSNGIYSPKIKFSRYIGGK